MFLKTSIFYCINQQSVIRGIVIIAVINIAIIIIIINIIIIIIPSQWIVINIYYTNCQQFSITTILLSVSKPPRDPQVSREK